MENKCTIGVNGYTINNDVDLLLTLHNAGLISTYECNRQMFITNRQVLRRGVVTCNTFSSLISGNYDISTKQGREDFKKEFCETISFANDVGATKLMFGMARYRTDMTTDKLKFLEELVLLARDMNKVLLYEAIALTLHHNEFLGTHDELIQFSKEHNIGEIHVDYGTLLANSESFNDIASKIKVSNIHFPYGKLDIDEVMGYNISIENYNSVPLTEAEITNYLTLWQKEGQYD